MCVDVVGSSLDSPCGPQLLVETIAEWLQNVQGHDTTQWVYISYLIAPLRWNDVRGEMIFVCSKFLVKGGGHPT